MPTEPKASTGPRQALIYHIEHLQQLLEHLPSSLPLDPAESLYQFYIDEDHVADAGTVFPVAGRALELSFGTWERDAVVKFTERGSRVAALGPFLKSVKAWISRLLQAAKDSGTAIPPHTAKGRDREASDEEAPIVIDSDDNNNNTHPLPSIHSSFGPKQTTAPNTVILSTAAVDLKVNTQATLERKRRTRRQRTSFIRSTWPALWRKKSRRRRKRRKGSGSWGLHSRGDFERRSRRRRRQKKRVRCRTMITRMSS
ncbi:hypothetical protein B0H10DRAFT_2024078 [Mycena sp. CBHHK59/15]|nr:hypothetical protein B0H10DRAFT_2024078 [Mycena sp. CBHHK59/15]